MCKILSKSLNKNKVKICTLNFFIVIAITLIMVEGSNPCQGITFPKVFAPPVNSNRHDYIVHGQCYYVIEVGMGYQTTRDN